MPSNPPSARIDVSDEACIALRNLGELLAQDLPEVQEGHLWRGRWEDVTAAGVVLEVDSDDALAELAVFTVDVEYADSYTGIVDAADCPLGVDIAVFAGLTAPVPLFTLDRWLGAIDDATLAEIRSLWRTNLSGMPPKDPAINTGNSDLDEADARREYRRALRAEVGHLQAAELIDMDAAPAMVDLPQRLVEASIAPSDLVSEKVTLSYARQAAEGNAAVTPELAQRIAELLGEPDPSIFENDGPALPEALADCLRTPRSFRVVRDIMASECLDEVAAARRIPAIAKFRQIQRSDDQSDEEFWQHALHLLETSG